MIESAVIPPRKEAKPGEPLPEGKPEVAIIPPKPEPPKPEPTKKDE